jgi:phage tail sheath gpL-like
MADCGAMPKAPRSVIVHGLAHARAAAAAAAALDVPVRIRSAQGAASYGGAGWFMEMIDIVRAEYPTARIEASLDCADAPGHAMAALRRGARMIRFRGTRTTNPKIAELAASQGAMMDTARAAPLDLFGIADPERACLDWLGRKL